LEQTKRQARFVLLDDPDEMAGQRLDIRFFCELPFPPVERVSLEEIAPA